MLSSYFCDSHLQDNQARYSCFSGSFRFTWKEAPRNMQKLSGDKAYTSQFYQCELWEKFSLRLVVEPKRNAVRSENRFFPDLELYRNSPGLWKSSLDFSAKTFVELTFAKAQQLALPLSARKTENKRKQILCRFLRLNFKQVLKLEQKWCSDFSTRHVI